jgi:signal transduction histidine kinase
MTTQNPAVPYGMTSIAVPRGALPAAAALTLIGVPFGLAISGGHTSGVMTGTLAVTLAALALLLRRWPLSVLIVSVLIVAAMRSADLIGSGWAWPATAAFAAVVLAGRLRAAVIVAACVLLYGFQWDFFVDLEHGPNWALTHVGGEALWIAAVLAAAHAYRSTRRWRAEVAARLVQDEHERELEARRRRAEERVGIARDLHDVVSHTLAVVGVHLNVAIDAFDSDPAEAKGALRLAQDVRGRAMTDLKALVDVLRDGAAAEPAGGLDGLDRLAAQVRDAGLAVTVTESGDRTVVPAPVATAVYRVVQEALTNTVRHAGASRVEVRLRYDDAEVDVEVVDNGSPGAGPVTDGHGIAGMRERVAALGGALTAGPTAAGFTVRATIPR